MLVRAVYSQGPESGDGPALSRAPLMATSLGMIREDGTTIRFADEARVRPALSAESDADGYTLTIRYQPQQPGELVGRPLIEADGFVAVSLNLGAVLARQGLRCDRIRMLQYWINGSAVASAADLPLEYGQTRLDLPGEFLSASQRASTSSG